MVGYRSALCLLVVICGCGKSDRAGLQITGKVTLDGKPLEGATVTFVPIGATPGIGAAGTTDSSGEYKLAPRRKGEPVAQGDYKVVVSRWLMPDGSQVPKGTSPANAGAMESLPPSYRNLTATVLKANPSNSNTKFDFNLNATP